MKRQTTDAPTMLIAIGRNMIVFAVFSPRGLSRSASTATARPTITHAAGTMRIQSRVLNSVPRKACDPNSVE